MPKTKLLYLVTQAELGGAQKYIFELASAFKDNYEVTVVAGERAGSRTLLDRCREAGIATLTLRHLVRRINPWRDLAAIFELVRLFRFLKPDLIHLNSSKAGVLGSLASSLYKILNLKSKICNPKIVYTVHGWAFMEPIGALARAIYFLAEWITGRAKDAMIALSEHEKKIGIRLRIAPASRFTVIPHGIDPDALDLLPRDDARTRLNRISNFWIGTIGNLYATKGLDILMRAFTQLSTYNLSPYGGSPEGRQPITYNLIIIGEGPERPHLERLIQDLRLTDCVILAGSIPDAARYLNAFDLFVLPSRKEGLPWTLLEAAAAGLPIIATRVGGVPELLRDGKEALLVPPDNPRALAWAIEEMIANHALREKLGLTARDRITREFSNATMLKRTKDLYASFIANDKPLVANG